MGHDLYSWGGNHFALGLADEGGVWGYGYFVGFEVVMGVLLVGGESLSLVDHSGLVVLMVF